MESQSSKASRNAINLEYVVIGVPFGINHKVQQFLWTLVRHLCGNQILNHPNGCKFVDFAFFFLSVLPFFDFLHCCAVTPCEELGGTKTAEGIRVPQFFLNPNEWVVLRCETLKSTPETPAWWLPKEPEDNREKEDRTEADTEEGKKWCIITCFFFHSVPNKLPPMPPGTIQNLHHASLEKEIEG